MFDLGWTDQGWEYRCLCEQECLQHHVVERSPVPTTATQVNDRDCAANALARDKVIVSMGRKELSSQIPSGVISTIDIARIPWATPVDQ